MAPDKGAKMEQKKFRAGSNFQSGVNPPPGTLHDAEIGANSHHRRPGPHTRNNDGTPRDETFLLTESTRNQHRTESSRPVLDLVTAIQSMSDIESRFRIMDRFDHYRQVSTLVPVLHLVTGSGVPGVAAGSNPIHGGPRGSSHTVWTARFAMDIRRMVVPSSKYRNLLSGDHATPR
jgi:hypothetical protein